MSEHTITKTTTKIEAGQPISGMYSDKGGMCLDYSGIITAAEKDGNRYRIDVRFSNGVERSYSNVRADGESDGTLPMGECSCGARGSVFGLTHRHP